MRQFLIAWIVRPIVGVFIGQIFLQSLHLFGRFPDHRIAEWITATIQQPRANLLPLVQLIMTLIIGGVALVGYEVLMRQWWRPIHSGTRVTAARGILHRTADDAARTEPAPLITSDGGVFQWNYDSLLGGMVSDRGHYISKFWIEGSHQNNYPIQIEDARIVSRVTGQFLHMEIRTDQGYLPPTRAYPVPPGAKVYLHALLYDPVTQDSNNPEGITATEFLQQWGAFTFRIAYTRNEQKESYSRDFDYPTVAARIAAMNPLPVPRPRVTARQQIPPMLTGMTAPRVAHIPAYRKLQGQIVHDMYRDGNKMVVGPDDKQFVLRFSSANSASVHMYKDGLDYLARIRGRSSGEVLRMADYVGAASSFTISIGEHFLGMNKLGQMIQGKIIDVKYDGRGADHHEVTFDYVIAPIRGGDFVAL